LLKDCHSCYIPPLIIEQTVDITEDHYLHLALPLELPVGRAKVEVIVTPEPARAKTAEEWVNPLRGRAKALGSKLTLERFMEMQREDIDLENELDDRLWNRGT
jgi:hypothetical protein